MITKEQILDAEHNRALKTQLALDILNGEELAPDLTVARRERNGRTWLEVGALGYPRILFVIE